MACTKSIALKVVLIDLFAQYKVREELRNYFDEFKDRGEVNGERVRSLYVGFSAEKFKSSKETDEDLPAFSLVMEESSSILDMHSS
jgi:hypothetical protein